MSDELREGELAGGYVKFADGVQRRINSAPMAENCETIAALFQQVEGAYGSVSAAATAITDAIDGDETIQSGIVILDEIR